MTSELRPAMEVWRDAINAYYCKDRIENGEASTAVIEADREAVRAEQAAENERLRGALRLLLEDYLGIYPNDTAYTTISLVDPETEPAVIEARAALGEKQ